MRTVTPMKLVLRQIALLGCAVAVSAMTPDEAQAGLRSNSLQQPGGVTNNRVKRDIAETELKRLFPAADKLEYLREFHSGGGYTTFHIAKHTSKQECVLQIGPKTERGDFELKVDALKAIGKVAGFPEVVEGVATKEMKYSYYATSPIPGPNFLALIAAGKVTQQQAQRWLYKLAALVLAIHTKGYTYNGMFLYNVYLHETKKLVPDAKSAPGKQTMKEVWTNNEILVQPDGTPPAALTRDRQLEDFVKLMQFIRYVLRIWVKEEGLQKMHGEESAAFGQTAPKDKVKAFKDNLLTFLSKQGGWLANANAADDSPITSWTEGQALETKVNMFEGKACINDAYIRA